MEPWALPTGALVRARQDPAEPVLTAQSPLSTVLKLGVCRDETDLPPTSNPELSLTSEIL